MTVRGALTGGRRAVLQLLTDTCVITRPQPAGPFDPATGAPAVVPPPQIYSGICRLKITRVSTSSGGAQVAGDTIFSQELTLSLPADSPAIEVTDIIVITGSEFRPDFVGCRLRAVSKAAGSQTTAQRLQVEVVTG